MTEKHSCACNNLWAPIGPGTIAPPLYEPIDIEKEVIRMAEAAKRPAAPKELLIF